MLPCVFVTEKPLKEHTGDNIRESSAQFENRIKPCVYVRRIMRSTMYEKAPFCLAEAVPIVVISVEPDDKPKKVVFHQSLQ